MSEARKLGLQISLGSGPIRERLALAKEAEDLGYTSLWVAEVSGPDALVSLGGLALNTSKADLATGVIPIQIRTPGAMAMSFLTINEYSQGRAIAGLGVSSPIIVERWQCASARPSCASCSAMGDPSLKARFTKATSGCGCGSRRPALLAFSWACST